MSYTVVLRPLKPSATTTRPSFSSAVTHDLACGMQIVALGRQSDQVHID